MGKHRVTIDPTADLSAPVRQVLSTFPGQLESSGLLVRIVPAMGGGAVAIVGPGTGEGASVAFGGADTADVLAVLANVFGARAPAPAEPTPDPAPVPNP